MSTTSVARVQPSSWWNGEPLRDFFRRRSRTGSRGRPFTPQKELLETITMPVLALSGDVDLLPGVDTSFFWKAAWAIANMVPRGKYQLLPGQNHDVKAEVLAPVLSELHGS